jgi:hypothetical protein
LAASLLVSVASRNELCGFSISRALVRLVALKVVLHCPGGQAMAGFNVDNVSVFFLAEGEQAADDAMARLTTFIRAAKQTLDFAIYDMRFSDPLKASLSSALGERADAGVEIRFCYDADKPSPPNVAAGRTPPRRAPVHLCNR